MSDILEKLNEEQIKPVLDTEGAVLVLAGAGSGKTRVLTSRIAYILEKGLSNPSGILAITFTNKAAKEMRERVEGILGDTSGMWICTIHSMCVRILRRFGTATGINSNFSIYSESERTNIIKKIVKELDCDEKMLKSVKYHIANAKTLGLDAEQYGLRYKDEANISTIVEAYTRYVEYLHDCNALDFDDLLTETLRLLKRDETSRAYISDKFRYVLVDEFQDTNSVQYGIIRLIAAGHGNLFAVGDDDQSIYGWRGAQIENILRFDKDYPQAKVYKLERNYRSTKSILSLANAVIAKNGQRHKKTLWTDAEEGVKPELVQSDDEKDEALFAAKTINAAVYSGGKYSDFAVLMRINALTRAYEQEFAKYGIPYKVFGGFKFFERKEIKDVLAYLRLISNPFDDEAFTRIINVPRRGIGAKTLEVMEAYAKDSGLSLYDACIDVKYLSLGASAKSKLEEFAKLLKKLVISSQTYSVGALVKEVIDSAFLRTAYDDDTEEGDAKLANIAEFIAAADDYTRLNPQSTLNDYLNQVTLASDTDDMDDGNYVTLATIHSVKGLEFENVILCGLEDGILPTSRANDDPSALEEERRLMYVAVTRAKKKLYLTRSKSRYLYGNREQTTPSRFLKDIKGQVFCKDEYSSPRSGYGSQRGYGARSTYRDGYEGDFWDDSSYGSSRKSSYGGSSYGKSSYGSSAGGSYGGYRKSEGAGAAKPFSAASTFGGVGRSSRKSGGKYTVGCKVRHPKFGVGVVIALKNDGAVVDVAFENQGIKELSASIAPLEII